MATKNPKKEPVIKTYLVLSPLRNGEDDPYEEGDLIEMNAADAAELVDAGVLQERKAKTDADAPAV